MTARMPQDPPVLSALQDRGPGAAACAVTPAAAAITSSPPAGDRGTAPDTRRSPVAGVRGPSSSPRAGNPGPARRARVEDPGADTAAGAPPAARAPAGEAPDTSAPSAGQRKHPRRPRRASLEPSEAQFQKAVTDLADMLGIWWYHPYQSKFDTAGWPDLTFAGSRKTIFRELKKTGEVPSAAQLDVGERLLRTGLDWDLWYPADMKSGRIKRELEAIR